MEYKFFGNDTPAVKPKNGDFAAVLNQRRLYDLLSDIWCEYTCAPNLRDKWSKENRTVGQCSITSFLVQDIFGGDVYGVPLKGGAMHCYNIVDGVKFDLTSEQFMGEPITYTEDYPQSREAHFSNREKYERYLYLKTELMKKLDK